jgi:antitoxin CptB
MTNKEILMKKIIFRSKHRGTKEMDLLLGEFVNKNINTLNLSELNDLIKILEFEDGVLMKWYFNQNNQNSVPINEVSKKLKKFRI